jgi:hypothetical protein
MTASTTWVPAVGGTRQVPAPDPIARDYILLAFRLEQHVPGTVDAYFGPSDLKAQVDIEQPRSPARLREDAADLRARLAAEVPEPDRHDWLDVQLVALEAQAAELAGDHLPYLELVSRYLGIAPPRHPDDEFRAATATIDALLPGPGTTADRLAALDARLVVPPDRILPVTQWLVDRFRAVARDRFGLPDGEDLRLGLVKQQPWGAYNWFHGGGRSRIDINTDLPLRAMGVPRVAAHEAYPGHHLEHAWKEADLVDRQGRLENSVLVMNAPECVISEGLANVGFRFVASPDKRVDLYAELFERAGLADPAHPGAIRESAELTETLWAPRRTLAAIDGNAAILRNADGLGQAAVVDYLCDVGAYAQERAQKRMEFLEHPVWRTYVFVYAEGEALLERWLAAVPPDEQPTRFARLLHEQLTPGAVTIPD